jgi:hypothetical protein
MAQLLLAYMWTSCPEELKALARNHSAKDPKAVLVFDYWADLEALGKEYKKQNPEVRSCELKTIKFLPEKVFSLIPMGVLPFAQNMFTLLLAW